MTQQLSGRIGEIAFLTSDQDKPPKPQPGLVRTKIQSGLEAANTVKVRAEVVIKVKSERPRQ